MSKIVREVLGANQSYAQNFGKKGELACPRPGPFAILICMDARLDQAKDAGLAERDAHVTSATPVGARPTTPPARHPPQVARRQGVFVIRHTNCGMELFSDEIMADLLGDGLIQWKEPNRRHKGRRAASRFIKWHIIKGQEPSVTQDMRRIREHPLVPHNVPVYGYAYDVKTGRLNEV